MALKMNDNEKKAIVKMLAKQLHNLEYVLQNKEHATKAEGQQAEEGYEQAKDDLMQLILVTAKDMGYPQIQDWSDTAPMTKLNNMADGELATTDYYQEILGLIMMGAITSA